MPRKRVPGFGEGFTQTFAPTLQEVMMMNLRQLLSQPEREQEAEYKKQMIDRSQQLIQSGEEETARRKEEEPLRKDKLKAEIDNLNSRALYNKKYRDMMDSKDPLVGSAVTLSSKNPALWALPAEQRQQILVDNYEMLKALGTNKKPVQPKGSTISGKNVNPKTGKGWAPGDVSPTGFVLQKDGKWVKP